jgi:hypothetical protein
MRPLRLASALILFGLLTLSPAAAFAGGGGGGGGPCAGFASGNKVLMRDSCFNGVAHFAEAGAALKISNEGHLPHSFTAVDGSFDTGVLEPGESATVQLEKASLIQVYCVLHGRASGEGMAGLLVVGEPAVLGLGDGGAASAVVAQQNDAILTALEAQSANLAQLRTDLAAVRQSVEARAASPQTPNDPAAALGALGTLLGGGALALVVYRRRSSLDALPAKAAPSEVSEP